MASRRAIISVSDKTGILEFAKELVKMDFELVSTGGTYQTIKEAGIPVTYVSEGKNAKSAYSRRHFGNAHTRALGAVGGA